MSTVYLLEGGYQENKITGSEQRGEQKKKFPTGDIISALCISLPICIWLWTYDQAIPGGKTPIEFCGIDCLYWLQVYWTAGLINSLLVVTCKLTIAPEYQMEQGASES